MEEDTRNFRMLRSFLWYLILLALVVASIWSVRAWGQTVSIQPNATVGATTLFTCTTTPTAALAANAKRRTAILLAPSTNTASVWFGFRNTISPAAKTAIPLPAGIMYTDDTYVGAYYCATGSGTQELITGEITR
jgi:hypothetical protein